MVAIDYLTEKKLTNNNFIGIAYDDSSKIFIKNNMRCRYYGPARIFCGYKSWWFNDYYYGNNDNKYNQKQFLKDLNKKWLL